MRSKLLIKNTIANLGAQLVAVVCGLILPRLILINYGSETNGLISSITQFLNYITLLEAGVGGIARAALYKPLADCNREKISAILVAVERFFKNIAKTFIVYMVALAIIFPYIVNSTFKSIYISSLVVIIGLSTIAQYYFGITYQILLQADQRKYIANYIQIVTTIVNTIVASILIHVGQGIHVVKLASAVIFVVRPIIINNYVRKEYGIITEIIPDNEAIKQRWSGLGHHIAYFLQTNTDVFILTIFMTPLEVSVYAVYKYVIGSLSNLLNSFTSSLEASFGNIIASNDREVLKKTLSLTECITTVMTTIAFTVCAILIFSFIQLYTAGIKDANYIQPVFAFIFIFNEWLVSVRTPSNNLVLAAGHYRKTQLYAYAEAGINMFASVALVNIFGMAGIVFATCCSSMVRAVCFIQYMNKNILKVNLMKQYGRYLVNLVTAVILTYFISLLDYTIPSSYLWWGLCAIPVTFIVTVCVCLINLIIFREDFINLQFYVKRMLKIER